MPTPVVEPTSSELVKAWLQIKDDRLDDIVDACVGATNVVVRSTRYAASIDAADWPEPIIQGATMLAGRLVRRRNSPDGVQALTDQGAVYVSRSDPDVALLLRLGRYARPAVG